MSTFQLSFKTELSFISVIEDEGYIADINFIIIKYLELRN